MDNGKREYETRHERGSSKVNRIPTEAEEQRALFQWAALNEKKYPVLKLLHHIPNGGSRNLIEARHLKEQGVKAGVPDIFLPSPAGMYCGLFIELKRRQRGEVSAAQHEWLVELNRAGYKAVVCKGWEEASKVILEYLRI